MDNSTSLEPEIVPTENGAPPMATHITPPSSVTNGHTPPPGEAYGDGATPADLNASVEGKGDGKGSWTPGFRAQTAPERALKWDRYFTQPGQDAFETLDWEKRAAGITGEDGKSVFEQTDCEIPKSWSQLATNVVVSKYFRGPLGSPQRETSVKQVIGRVADTIGLWGAQGGYFASDEDTANFREELAYLLVHQYGAFNSPVWFNLGVKGARQQCSACFINDVYDDMESIMELAATEARLFKGGSGAGVNLWRIRSSKEHLRGGGIASGPISFMRGWDSFAGAVKSGGTTRRAAKMVILNSDHPDIGEFITCKADEEKKAWALIEAGYNGGFNVPGGAYDSVAFQNANHSVRVTDEFMQAAQNDKPWNLRAVTTGQVTDTTSAREMLKDIAQATWICGDPGMQFDTIINDWHTCSNSDRIYASNPCSEFMFLNSTACNLASLNLLKFYNMETGEFDAAAYSRACETFITAQEIIVSFASYPTKTIGEMSEQYRPLGLGYANLGALLMAKGLAYDSDEGRALAGALTAIMTGAAYRKSAQIARNTGPFEGYAQNREPMLRVIAKHRDAVNGIDANLVAENIMQEARNVWDDAYMTGQKYGYRNSQATVLAPTGCLVAGSLVSTDRGLVRLERLGDPDGATWQNADFRVYTDGGIQNATKFFINGVEETRVITTQAGYSIQGTGKHRVKVVNAQTGAWQWKHFRDIEAGDLLPLAMNTLIGEAQTVTLPLLGELHWNGEWNTRVPAQMSAELAELVGYFMGDGSLHAKGLRFCVAQSDDDVAARLAQLGRKLFGLQAHLSQRQGYIEVAFNSVALAHWWDAAGFAKAAPDAEHRGKGYVPRVPDAVLHCNDAQIYGAFLRGLYEADGTNTLGVPAISTAHAGFAGEIRSLLLALGFPTSSKIDNSQWGDSNLHVLRLRNGSYNPQWLSKIGFMGARKTSGVVELKGALSGKRDRVFLPRQTWEELVPCGHPLRNAMVIALKRHGGVARQLAAQIHAQSGDERLAHALNYFFDEVQTNQDGGAQMTYDLSVPANVTYVANGFVSHNTISFMMDCDTTGVEPDIALVKYKKLVGGGLLKIVNQTVPAALRNLGYDESEIKTIVDYIDKNDTIEGAPGLRDEDLSVFDCAFKAMNGTRSIHHIGHIKMMAATQPFISGAISKCVTGETLITTSKGIVPIASFYRGEKPGEFTPLRATLASIGAPQEADLFYYGGNRPTIRATWADGRSIEGTPNHRVKVANASGYDWKRMDALETGDYVAVKLGANLWAEQNADLLEGFAPSALYGCQKTIRLPEKMTPGLARFLGMYIAEGNMTKTTYTVRVTNLNADVLSACERIICETFGIAGRIEIDKRNGLTSWVCASKTLCEFLQHIGAGGDSSGKQIPWSVLQSSENCVREFIGGLWLDGYVRKDGMTAICLNSPELLRQLQVVLNNFGLRAQRIRKYNRQYDKYFGELGLHGADARRFGELFRLDDAHKTEALQKLRDAAKKVDAVHSDVIPAFRAEIQAFVRAHRDTARFRNVFDAHTKHLSRRTVDDVAAYYGEAFFAAIPALREILENGIHFVALRDVAEGLAPVYDFQVPTNHAFLGNGLVNHNTVNMPQDSTADDIYDAYMQSWQMGVKAVAIYRDGSKRTQPLSTASDAQKAEKVEKKEGEIRRAARRKLPDERNSITHKFSIAGQEGYFMVGLYEDGSPGEIFIKMSKEGSTISGLMDSFAVAVSMCLQYGVPLRVLVNKFSHTRFEPSGYTTNRDIPIAKSLMDYIFRWFDLKFHPNGDNGHVGKVESATKAASAPASLFEESDAHGNAGNAQRSVTQMQQDAPPCPDCGALTVRSGACYKCNECGATTGCG